MSFHFTFTARDTWSARNKLREVYAPEAVKAVVELCIASLRPPQQPLPVPGVQVFGAATDGAASSGEGVKGEPQTTSAQPFFCGLLVEAWGHIDECGGKSSIDHFVFQPLFD